MRFKFRMAKWIYKISMGIFLHAAAAVAQPVDIPLGTPEGFTAVAVNAVGDDRYCVSGNVYDDAGPSTSAMVVLVDAGSRHVLWKTAIPHARGYAENSAVACDSNGHAFYVVTQEDTGGAQAQNQTRVVVSRISTSGKLEKQQAIDRGFDEWFYLLDVGPDGVAIAGGTSATVERGGPFGTFIASFDASLTPATPTKLDTGAFWTDTNARLDSRFLFVAGQFMPNHGAGRDAYAASKIDLTSGKYLWSTYALPTDTRVARSWLSPDDKTYTVALTPTDLSVVMLDRQGKVTSNFSAKKPLCTLDAISLEGHTLRVTGTSCESDSSTVLVPIDLTSRKVGAGRLLGNNLSAVHFDNGRWVGIAKNKGRGPSLLRAED